MCLSIPSRVVEIDEINNIALVDTMGVKRKTSLDLMGEAVHVGDYLLIHIGYAMNKIDEADAIASIEAFKEALSLLDEVEKREAMSELS